MSHETGTARVTERVRSAQPSQIRVMFDLAEDADGDLVRLEIGEPDFRTPEHIVEAAFEAARGGATGYTSNDGLPELREAIADRTLEDHGAEYDPATEITVMAGAQEGLLHSALSVVGPGEEVVIPTPGYPNYVVQAKLADAVPVPVPLPAEEGFALDPDPVVEAIGPETAAVVLNSPTNPTGRVHDEDAMRAVAEAAADHDAYVLADEVYTKLTYDGSRRYLAAYAPGNVLTVSSCSKAYAMTGWRVGWLAGPSAVVEQVTKIHESTSGCAAHPSQHAAIAALTGPQDPVEEMRAAFERRRDLVVERVAGIDGISCAYPEGAFYAFIDVSALGGTSTEVAKRLLREYGVVTAPGEGFGDAGRGYLRLSYANSAERLEEGFDRIGAMVRDEL